MARNQPALAPAEAPIDLESAKADASVDLSVDPAKSTAASKARVYKAGDKDKDGGALDGLAGLAAAGQQLPAPAKVVKASEPAPEPEPEPDPAPVDHLYYRVVEVPARRIGIGGITVEFRKGQVLHVGDYGRPCLNQLQESGLKLEPLSTVGG